jgi:hypothetical protein
MIVYVTLIAQDGTVTAVSAVKGPKVIPHVDCASAGVGAARVNITGSATAAATRL